MRRPGRRPEQNPKQVSSALHSFGSSQEPQFTLRWKKLLSSSASPEAMEGPTQLKLLVHRMSQPSRTCLLFCK